MKELFLIGFLAAVVINLYCAQADIAEWQQKMFPKKYNCSSEGLKAMIIDGLEDETINIICKGEFK